MKTGKIKAFIVIFISVLFSCGSGGGDPSGAGRVFYVDSAAGSDLNDGQSEGTAWASIAKVNAEEFQPGDTICFKRGLTYEGGIELAWSGSVNSPITIDAYGAGPKPVFLGSRVETGWSFSGGSIYQKEISYTPGKNGAGVVLEDGVPLAFREWNIDAPTSLGAESGVFTYDPRDLSSSVVYVRCSDSGNPSAHEMAVAYYLIGVHSLGVSHIVIMNIQFKNYSLHGVSLRNSHHITVSECVAENIGGAALTVSPSVIYAGNGYEFTLNSTDCVVENSFALNIFDSGFSPQVFESNAAIKNVAFVNCIADRCGFAGIEVSVLNYGGSSNESIEDIRIESCMVKNSGTGWSGVRYGTEGHGIRVKADDGAGTISGVSIAQTEVRDCAGSGMYIGGEAGTVDVSRARISGNQYGIQCAGLSGVSTLKLRLTSSLLVNHVASESYGIVYNVATGSNFEIVNNTFCNNSLSLFLGPCGTGIRILRNNVFYSNSTLQAYVYCATSPEMQSDYNCFFAHGGNIIAWNSSVYTALTGFSGATGYDSNSVDSDPLFVDPSSNWHLKTSPMSPCKNSGVSSGVTIDYDGNAYNSPPSRGAYR